MIAGHTFLATSVKSLAPGSQPSGQKFRVCRNKNAPIGRSPAGNFHSARAALLLELRGETSHQMHQPVENSSRGPARMLGYRLAEHPQQAVKPNLSPFNAASTVG